MVYGVDPVQVGKRVIRENEGKVDLRTWQRQFKGAIKREARRKAARYNKREV